MTTIQTMQEIEREHPHCWILVHDVRRDRSQQITGGRIAVAAERRDDFNGQVSAIIDSLTGELLFRYVPDPEGDEFIESEDLWAIRLGLVCFSHGSGDCGVAGGGAALRGVTPG